VPHPFRRRGDQKDGIARIPPRKFMRSETEFLTIAHMPAG
jgi:hypothetical protein